MFKKILGFAKEFFTSSKSRPVERRKFPEKKDDYVGESSRQQSLRNSQGKSDFSGSGYNGPGNVDHEKRNSNMSQRNF